MWRRVIGYRPGRLGRNAILGTTGLGVRALVQAAYLLVVSHWLGVAGYGLFAGSVALVMILAPLANWGSSLLITHHVARDRNRSRAMWATALVQTAAIGSLLTGGVVIVAVLFLQDRLPVFPLLFLAISELLLLPAALAATSHCYALEHGSASAFSVSLVPVCRLGAMIVAIAMGVSAIPEHAVMAHFAGSIAGFAMAVALVGKIDGAPAWRERLSLVDSTRQGAGFAVSNMANTSYLEIDKVLMLQLLGAAAVGSYTVAFRVASIFALPISALVSATLPRMIALHHAGSKLGISRPLMGVALTYGLLAGGAMLVLGPFVPMIFGPGYMQAAQWVSWLSPWPVLFAVRQSLAADLTARNRQGHRSAVEIGGFLLVSALNIILLPKLGIAAAVFSLIATELLVSVLFWYFAFGKR